MCVPALRALRQRDLLPFAERVDRLVEDDQREDVGLLEPQRSGRNRVYSQRERTRLKLTLRGKRLGLSLSEIKQLVDMYDSPSDTTQQLQAFLGVLGEHRRLLEQQREDIEITLAEIAQHEERCRSLLAAAAGKTRRR